MRLSFLSLVVALVIALALVSRVVAAAEHVIGVRATFAGGLPYIESPEIGGAVNWRIEDATGFYELDMGLHGPFTHDGDGAIWVGAGRSFYLIGDYYLGGGLQLRGVYDGIDNTGCWATGVEGQGGYMFMHDQSTRVYLELRVVQNVLPFNCKDALDVKKDSTRTHWRTEVGFSVGIGF
jgi:hypothetical protein